jgi:hypothetical protein
LTVRCSQARLSSGARIEEREKPVGKDGDQRADKNSPLLKSVVLDVETQLKDPKGQHEMIVDPVKSLMDKGNVRTITLNDTKAHATWTYTLAPPCS